MTFYGIDYSGAQTPDTRLTGLRIYRCGENTDPQELRNDHRNWARRSLAEFLIAELKTADSPCIIGIDHAFAFPIDYSLERDLATYDDFLDHIHDRWPALATSSVDTALADSPPDREIAIAYHPRGLRLCDRWTTSASSVYRLQGQGSVGKSTFSGLPWLREIRRSLAASTHFWPFDGWSPAPNKHIIAEIYPSLWKRRFPHPDPTANPHQKDAYCVARWLQEMHARNELADYFQPPLLPKERHIAQREGWILGVR